MAKRISWNFVMSLTSQNHRTLHAILLAAPASQMPTSLNGTETGDYFRSSELLSEIPNPAPISRHGTDLGCWRSADRHTLQAEIAAWQQQRNARGTHPMHVQFGASMTEDQLQLRKLG